MTTSHSATVRRAGTRRPGARRGHSLLSLLTASALALGTAACSTSTADDSARDVVQSLGAVPIPTAPATEPTPTADQQHPQLLAIGAPVEAILPTGRATITALGPEIDLPTGTTKPPEQVNGTITLRVVTESGSITVAATDLTSRDDSGNDIRLTPVGASGATGTPGTAVELKVAATFHTGAAQITLRHAGKIIALWTFNVENG